MEGTESVSLSEIDKLLFENIQKENVSQVRVLLSQRGSFEEVIDENGMSMLQHAAYKGNKELCSLLIDWGADVNSKRHVYGYTTLMFAALAGKLEVVSYLLNAGACSSTVNNVGKTASETAAFVGNHACAVLINNFIPKSEVEYYTKRQGLETVAKLSTQLVGPLHSLLVRPNIHPISIVMFLQSNILLFKEADKVCKVLDLMCEKEMKRADVNDLFAFKFHFYSFIIQTCQQIVTPFIDESGDVNVQMEKVIKLWMKESKNDGVQDVLEAVVRQGIREFPYKQSPVIQKMVHCLTNTKVSTDVSAISVLTTTVNGHRMFAEQSACATCASQSASKKCSVCKSVDYCDQRCQKFHWPSHKKLCQKLAADGKSNSKKDEEMNLDQLNLNQT